MDQERTSALAKEKELAKVRAKEEVPKMTMAEEAVAWLDEISANNLPADSSPAKSAEKEQDIFDFDSPFIFEVPEKAPKMSHIEEAMTWFDKENAKIHARETAEKVRRLETEHLLIQREAVQIVRASPDFLNLRFPCKTGHIQFSYTSSQRELFEYLQMERIRRIDGINLKCSLVKKSEFRSSKNCRLLLYGVSLSRIVAILLSHIIRIDHRRYFTFFLLFESRDDDLTYWNDRKNLKIVIPCVILMPCNVKQKISRFLNIFTQSRNIENSPESCCFYLKTISAVLHRYHLKNSKIELNESFD